MSIIRGMFFLSTVGIPLLETIGGTEAIACILVFVLYMGIDRDVALIAIVVVHILLFVGVTTGRM